MYSFLWGKQWYFSNKNETLRKHLYIRERHLSNLQQTGVKTFPKFVSLLLDSP